MFGGMEVVLQAVTFLISFGVITVLFAMIYKVLPNVKIDWSDVWIGAAITALLFEVGKVLIGLYIGKSSVAASFGAAGPFVVLMLWIYYSTQIFLLGAEFTFAYAHRGQPKPRASDSKAAAVGEPALNDASARLEQAVARSSYEALASEVQASARLSPALTKRTWLVSAAGLLTGLAAAQLLRNIPSKFR
jgi:hypothetical protein